MRSLLHHVSTHDHPVSDDDMNTSLRMVDHVRRTLSDCEKVYDMPADQNVTKSVRMCGSGHLEIIHDEISDSISADPTRRVHLIDGRHGRNAIFVVESCMKPYGSVREDDHATGVDEIMDLVECALHTAPLTPGRMSARLKKVMDGVAWIHSRPEDAGNRMGMPWIWLAPSPVRGMQLNAIEQPFDLHSPQMCCLNIRHEPDRLVVRLGTLAGHTFDKRMSPMDGMRAVRELEEWRAEDLGSPHGRTA